MGQRMDPHRYGGDSSVMQHLTTRYIKHSKSVAILWGVFTFCSAVLNIVVFLQEEWVGETTSSKSPGHFGLWRFCTILSDSSSADSLSEFDTVQCVGRLDNFASILSPAFRAATVFVGLSVIVSVLSVIAMLLFCFMKGRSAFEICGTMQLLAGICMLIGVLCFPAGWDNDHVRGICGAKADDYVLGNCGVRWAFVLAVVAIFDSWILGCLAFTLSHRHAKPNAHYQAQVNAEPPYMSPGSIYKGEINSGFIGDVQSLAGSRKSLNIQPVMMLPHAVGQQVPNFMPSDQPPPQMMPPPPPDVYADFNPRTGGQNRSNIPSPYRQNNPYASSIQNFQL